MTQLAAGLALIATGSAIIFAAMQTGARSSRVQRLIRVRGMLRQLEQNRHRLANTTPYTGPIYNRHGREIAARPI